MHQDSRKTPRSSVSSTPSPFVTERPDSGYYPTHALDRAFKANLARMTAGVTPAGLTSVYFEWLTHLALSPGKQVELGEKALRKSLRLGQYVSRRMHDPATPPCIEPMPQDRRFDDEAWQQWPYNLIYQSFLLTQQWWHNATTDVEGLPPQREHVVNFLTRQLLDRWSPSNIPWLNPEVTAATLQSGGKNLVDGWQNVIEDWERNVSGKPPVGAERFHVGEELAVTPGKVVYRNHLIELIQYTPNTEQVHAEPILVVPAWIMKYYILDLTPGKSVVEYLVEQGYTVFMISWRNPGSEDRDLGMEDYRRLGPMAALDVVTEITGQSRVHGVGYCLGGTLLSIAAAGMARDGDERLASLTTLATQVDFTEAGELMLFIGESQVSYLENMMWDQGYLDGYQMAGAFQILRSNDLVWSRMVHNYLLGQRQPMNELMAWNADITRLPYRMHSEYLRHLFLDNDLASGRYQVEHRPVAIQNIRVPILAVATIKDHVAPWQSVYKVHLLTDVDEVTFLLTSGGHNAGIISEPGHPGRHFQMRTQHQGEPYVDPLSWRDTMPEQEGSWWPAWQEWLETHSSGKTAPPPMGSERFPPLEDAPGSYVRQP
ncbi:PHA/PHB synthase family protein [Halomonas alkalisoli]|uniref:PHA/PHB synthase family protein n=1 Tax=Halomonas alkalisoli TaxID=2907158 RepID=UPI001F166D28|nr:alpha/beta fold hydrolase [Halomonas alkalisoli]MCE9680748.1 alpha/beta fold hydrolase [Halomonas alkalisoli]